MGIDIDFGVVKEYVPTAPGVYFCVIEDCQLKPSQKDAEKWVIHVDLTITEDENFDGRKVKDWVYIDPENPFGLQSFVQSIMQSEEVNNFTLDQEWCDQVVGENVKVQLVNGKPDETGKRFIKVGAYLHD